jgi:hypothetical protein
MLRDRLTPSLQNFVASSLEEIEHAVKMELPVHQGTDTHFLSVANFLVMLTETLSKQMNGRQ